MLQNSLKKEKLFSDMRKKLPKKVFKEIFKELNHEFFNENRVIFNFGDIGRKVFLILQGKVSILIPKKHDSFRVDFKKKSKIIKDKNEMQKDRKKNEKFNEKVLYKNEEEEILAMNYPNFIKVNELNAGQSFGEIALYNKVPRTATVICSENTHCVILTGKTYQRLVGFIFIYFNFIN